MKKVIVLMVAICFITLMQQQKSVPNGNVIENSKLVHEKYKACIDACNACIISCNSCIKSCSKMDAKNG